MSSLIPSQLGIIVNDIFSNYGLVVVASLGYFQSASSD